MKKEMAILFGMILVLTILGSVSAVTLQVNSPGNEETYADRRVSFDLSSDKVSDFYYLKTNEIYKL